jgi:cytochrome c biogenesis protein ResB
VAILEEGAVVGRKRIEVNAPLYYGGYYFLQNSYSLRSKPVQSTFQVHRDPGLGLAYAGFVLLVLGCIHLFYVKPLAAFRRRRAAPASGPLEEETPASSGAAEPAEPAEGS